MTLEVTTNFKLNADPSQQKTNVLPIFLHLYEQGLTNLYFSRNEAGNLVVWIDLNGAIPKSLSECFAGLTDCAIDSQRNSAFIPDHVIKVTSFVKVLKANLTTPSATEYMQILTKRHENLLQRCKALKKAQKAPHASDPFDHFGMGHSHARHDFSSPLANDHEKRERYEKQEREYLLLYRRLTMISTEKSASAPPIELVAITVPDTLEKTDITDEKKTGVTLTFTSTTAKGMQLAEHDSENLLRQVYEIINKHPAPFDVTRWVRNAYGAPTAMTFSAAGITLATIQFDRDRLSRVPSFSITLNKQTVTKRSFASFKEDTKFAMFKTGVDADYNFTGLSVKRTVVASNTKKLAKLTDSFEGSKPQWQVHKANANARFTLFMPKAAQADDLEAHLKAGGLKLFKRGKMSESKREIVTVNLAQRGRSTTASTVTI